MRGGIRFGSVVATLVPALLLAASPSAAEWKVYVQGGLGLSTLEADADGEIDDGLANFPIRGMDSDSSPLLDAAIGLEAPMDELVPRELLVKVRLPDWPVRLEVEAAGLREWEVGARANQEAFFTEIDATTVMFNSWVDVPLVSLYRPVQYLFGLGRQPSVRRWMEPMSLYVGTGVGLTAKMEINGTSNAASTKGDEVGFAWNAGTGINYEFTDRIRLSVGYRYVGLGEREVDAYGQILPSNDSVDYDLDVHELRVGLRVRVFEFPSPWR